MVGVIGEVHPRTLELFEIASEAVALFELDVDALARAVSTEPVRYRSIARYPGALRDLAVVLDAGVPAAQVQAIIERDALVSHAQRCSTCTKARAWRPASDRWPIECCSRRLTARLSVTR